MLEKKEEQSCPGHLTWAIAQDPHLGKKKKTKK
jgi:hypothetical protein